MSRRQFVVPEREGGQAPDDEGCSILHVDMDAFFALASLLSRPELKGTPVIIAGGGNRGVVLSATYEARAFGVAAATPIVEPLSLDEAFLDVSGARRRLGTPRQIGQWIRDTIADEQGITCSVGVATTKFIAKLASGLAKPDGMLVVPEAEVVGFLHQLPVGALWGVGDRTEEVLQRLGLRTVADIAHTPVDTCLLYTSPSP